MNIDQSQIKDICAEQQAFDLLQKIHSLPSFFQMLIGSKGGEVVALDLAL